MKRFFAVFAVLLVIFSLAGCSCSSSSSSTETAYDSSADTPDESVSSNSDSNSGTSNSNNGSSNSYSGSANSSSGSSSNSSSGSASSSSSSYSGSISIEGKWKSVGDYGFGQAQPGAIVVFDGNNCNFFSPKDTYAFYKDGDHYSLDCTSLMSTKTLTFKVQPVDKNNIDIYYGDTVTKLKRVE